MMPTNEIRRACAFVISKESLDALYLAISFSETAKQQSWHHQCNLLNIQWMEEILHELIGGLIHVYPIIIHYHLVI